MEESEATEVEVDEAEIEETDDESLEVDAEVEAEAVEDEDESDVTEVADDDELDRSEPEDVDAVADTSDAPSPSENAQPRSQPFSFKMDGEQLGIPGAVITEHDDGQGGRTESIIIPKERWEAFRHQLAYRPAVQREMSRLNKELQARDPDKHEKVVRAGAVLSKLDEIMESPEAFQDFVENFESRKGELKLLAENAVLRSASAAREATDGEERARHEQQERADSIRRDAPAYVEAAAQRLGVTLPPEVAADLKARVLANPGSYYTIGKEGDGTGLRPGQLGRIDAEFEREIQFVARLLQTGQSRSARAEAAETKNRRALGEGKQPPKTPSASGRVPETVKVQTYDSKEEWRKAMGGF